MNFTYQTLKVEIQKDLAKVFLSRPELHNAFNEVMIAELTDAFALLAKEASIRVVWLKGAGESFCAGADLNWMKKVPQFTREENIEDSQKLYRMFESIDQCPKPVIAEVNGAAVGGGVGLVAVADMAFAHEKAVLGLSEVRLGLIPAVISPFVIRKIGVAAAREYFLSAERFSASQAKSLGLINEVGNPEQIEQKILEKIKFLRQAAPGALADCKRLIRDVGQALPQDLALLTATRIAERRMSEEGQEGMNAFLEKRKANWS